MNFIVKHRGVISFDGTDKDKRPVEAYRIDADIKDEQGLVVGKMFIELNSQEAASVGQMVGKEAYITLNFQ